jgi:hypothetical protein
MQKNCINCRDALAVSSPPTQPSIGIAGLLVDPRPELHRVDRARTVRAGDASSSSSSTAKRICQPSPDGPRGSRRRERGPSGLIDRRVRTDRQNDLGDRTCRALRRLWSRSASDARCRRAAGLYRISPRRQVLAVRGDRGSRIALLAATPCTCVSNRSESLGPQTESRRCVRRWGDRSRRASPAERG